MSTAAVPQSFGQIHFAGLDLGDARVNQRVIDLADTRLAADADSWPDTFASPAEHRVFQCLVNRPQATHDAVRATRSGRPTPG